MNAIKFDLILFKHNQFGYLNLCFFERQSRIGLYCDGIEYCVKYITAELLNGFSTLKYEPISTILDKYVVEIKEFEDMTFFKMNNGDIFQIYFMCDDENSNQILSIFDETSKKISTPFGISIYDKVLKNMDEANFIELKNEVKNTHL